MFAFRPNGITLSTACLLVLVAAPSLFGDPGQFELEGHQAEVTDGEVIAEAQGREGVEAVRIHRARVSDAAFSTFAEWPDLYGVYLHDTAITGTGFSKLRNHPKLRQVTLLGPNVNDEGVRTVSRLPHVTHLQIGSSFRWDGHLYRPLITDKSLEALAAMDTLEYLTIDNASVTGDGLRHLQSLKSIRSILFLRCAGLTATGLNRLHQRLPKVLIRACDPDIQVGE
jgi:hypothetical protein